jgi:hypothetical protein
MNPNRRKLGWLKVGGGIGCLLVLGLWIWLLHNVTDPHWLHDLYRFGTRRSGSTGMWFLALGGLLLIGWGMENLLTDEDDEA